MTENQALQEKYVEYHMLEQQLMQIQNQIEKIEEDLGEINNVHEALDELKDTKLGSEILVPIANGIFLKAELKDNKQLLVNVGAKTVVKKDIESAKSLIKKQELEMLRAREELADTGNKLSDQYNKIEKELKELIQE